MSQLEQLKSLSSLLETFIEQVVAVKEQRLSLLEGMNRLDDIARVADDGLAVSDHLGDWFAQHNSWLNEGTLRSGDINRIGSILGEIKNRLDLTDEQSPAVQKIQSEINRWQSATPGKRRNRNRIILKRDPEQPVLDLSPLSDTIAESDSISKFSNLLERCQKIFADASGSKIHLLSALSDTLDSALIQQNKDALILSAFLIYYLRQNGYKVQPYVARLKEAERVHKRGNDA